ncbi:MAG: hypothetical protein OXI79_00065 [Gammaproteobacteria bacterium]|nr:hypothetical protein [Gammaproteobacteria bacterium]
MLSIPEVGFRQSVSVSRVDSNASADWLEASVLFDGPELSRGDVVDLLLEEQICGDGNQDLAHQIAEEAWRELERRQRWGGLPETVEVSNSKIVDVEHWHQDVIRAFFVLLAIQKIFPDWSRERQSYVTQGNLFEKVVEKICPAMLPGWNTYRAGWSTENTKRIPDIVADLTQLINVRGRGDLREWGRPEDKDGGLDLVCYRDFGDGREAMPVYFLQCASGKNWRDKINTPNAEMWHKCLDSAVKPSTGIVAPFVIAEGELRRAALMGQVVVFDRIRAVSAAREFEVAIERDLYEQVIGWMEPRVRDLPRAG